MPSCLQLAYPSGWCNRFLISFSDAYAILSVALIASKQHIADFGCLNGVVGVFGVDRLHACVNLATAHRRICFSPSSFALASTSIAYRNATQRFWSRSNRTTVAHIRHRLTTITSKTLGKHASCVRSFSATVGKKLRGRFSSGSAWDRELVATGPNSPEKSSAFACSGRRRQ